MHFALKISLVMFVLRFVVLSLAEPLPVILTIINNSDKELEVFWIDPVNRELKLIEPIIRGNSKTKINSFESHEFLIQQISGEINAQSYLTVGANDETIVVNYDSESGLAITSEHNASDNVAETYLQAIYQMCNNELSSKEDFMDCIHGYVLNKFTDFQYRESILVDQINRMSTALWNYTCSDHTIKTSAPLSTKQYIYNNASYNANIYLDMERAKIWSIENFVSMNECRNFISHGGPNLERATVVGDEGESIVSEHRKAQQAAYEFTGTDDPLLHLYEKVLFMARAHAGLDLHVNGQEGFTIIKYTKGDEYTPHCDGACDGSAYKSAGRVATSILYCQTAKIGGATVFIKPGVIINPKPGMAVFFSYKGSDGYMDEYSNTEHSGCPVIAGEKWIVTAWLREGVNENNDSSDYDPDGNPITDYEIDSDHDSSTFSQFGDGSTISDFKSDV